MGQEFRQGRAEMLCLYAMMSEASAGRLEGWELEVSKD